MARSKAKRTQSTPDQPISADVVEQQATSTDSTDSDQRQSELQFFANAGVYVKDSSVGILESAITPGIHASLVQAVNVVFVLVFICVLTLAVITRGNLHVLVFMGLFVLLFISFQWYAVSCTLLWCAVTHALYTHASTGLY
jgi:hypothetical protein